MIETLLGMLLVGQIVCYDGTFNGEYETNCVRAEKMFERQDVARVAEVQAP